MTQHTFRAFLILAWALWVALVSLADTAHAQRNVPRGPEARAGSRFALRNDPRANDWTTRRPQGGHASPEPSNQVAAAGYDEAAPGASAPSPPVLRWRTAGRTPQEQVASKRAAPSHQALSRVTQPTALAANEPAPFSPPEEASALGAPAARNEQPPQPIAEAVPSVDRPMDEPVDFNANEQAPSRASGRLAQALRRPSSARRRRSEPVEEGRVVYEFEQLGLRTASDEDDSINDAPRTAVARRDVNVHPEMTQASHEVPEHYTPTYVTDDVQWQSVAPPLANHCEPDCAVFESDCAMAYEPECGGAVCECGDACCTGDCEMCEVVSIWIPAPKYFTLFGGVQAFKGPLDGLPDNSRDRGNFGIHEGFNWGGCMPWFGHAQVGYQIGYQLTHSQLHGSSVTPLGEPTSSAHTQQFVTAGLFRRTRTPGWNYGAVWDVLRDDRFGAVDIHQLRAEIGLVNRFGREWGFATAVHTNDTDRFGTPYRAVNQFLLYYRIHAAGGGEARFYGGASDNDNAILGTNFMVPIHDCWSFQGGCTYLTAEDSGSHGAASESWNLGMSLVWHLGGGANAGRTNPYRPLFEVADNGSLLVEQRR